MMSREYVRENEVSKKWTKGIRIWRRFRWVSFIDHFAVSLSAFPLRSQRLCGKRSALSIYDILVFHTIFSLFWRFYEASQPGCCRRRGVLPGPDCVRADLGD